MKFSDHYYMLLKGNPNHSPSSGRFMSYGTGGSAAKTAAATYQTPAERRLAAKNAAAAKAAAKAAKAAKKPSGAGTSSLPARMRTPEIYRYRQQEANRAARDANARNMAFPMD